MSKILKNLAYRIATGTGFCMVVANSLWRRRRLSILCYHGISLDDEHIWNPSLFITADHFRARLDRLLRGGYNVLPLGEALERLADGSLPPKAAAITFDDGNHDFFVHAAPALQELRLPATVYMTTYYSVFNRPVFDPMLSYVLWKGSGRVLNWPEPLRAGIVLTRQGRHAATEAISAFASAKGLSGAEKDELLAALAARLDVDYADLCRRGILHRMNLDELRAVAAQGIDLQLHTHRHCLPTHYDEFARELDENRSALRQATSQEFQHFCYPSGEYHVGAGDLLRRYGLLSATTCDPGLAACSTDPYYLPRYCDSTPTTSAGFEAWISGASALLHSILLCGHEKGMRREA